MKPTDKTIGILSAGLLAGLCLCLGAGCASEPTQNRKVYDRYAELVAARTREAPTSPAAQPSGSGEIRSSKTPAAAKPAPDAPAKPAAKPAPVAPAKPKAEPAPVEPSAKLAPVVEPPPAVAPDPAGKPVLPAPVQVISPTPVEVSIPVQPVAEPARPAPVEAPAVETLPPPVVQSPPPPMPAATLEPLPASSTDGVAYLLKVGDVIQIFLRGIPNSDAIEDVIDENGNVSLPLINEVRASGMTAAELERTIRQIYLEQDIYRNIAVTVVVPTRYYFIQGEIRGPGRFQIVSATRVSQAIAAAGGYTEYASGQVVVKRGGKIVKTIRNAKRLERAPEDDVLLEPDDIIEVRRSLW